MCLLRNPCFPLVCARITKLIFYLAECYFPKVFLSNVKWFSSFYTVFYCNGLCATIFFLWYLTFPALRFLSVQNRIGIVHYEGVREKCICGVRSAGLPRNDSCAD